MYQRNVDHLIIKISSLARFITAFADADFHKINEILSVQSVLFIPYFISTISYLRSRHCAALGKMKELKESKLPCPSGWQNCCTLPNDARAAHFILRKNGRSQNSHAPVGGRIVAPFQMMRGLHVRRILSLLELSHLIQPL
ncbi:hypothetical protein CEXT_685581 [Caerostris extrusa]|uniref:Uncharacterized protein n=1 Tax=Caerostris extrusa TaxID=172846 RepID=A0AAV4RUX2_CAEEX|nr:hypothetical protein CEXT_685581 [Caerostris extrusa]